MATVTPNFNWPVPTSTDLVKDGATAIEALGDSIDGSLVDLKGGTTGQVLSKTSGTDMDFTWVTTDDANAIQNSIVDAKGDLIAASANDTPARLAVGTNGQVLTADSTAATGLAWSTVSVPTSLGFTAGKNRIINGDFFINQRGITSTGSTYGAGGTDAYTLDRWVLNYSSGTVTTSVQQFGTGAAPVSGYQSKQYLRSVVAGQTENGTAYALVAQKIEDVRTFAGQTATISFWAKAASGTPKIAVAVQQTFGSGGSPSSPVITNAGTVTLSTSWARYSVAVAVPSISGYTLGTVDNTSALSVWLLPSCTTSYGFGQSIGIQNNTFDFWGVQAEAGSTATAFQTATGTIQGELSACRRYLPAFAGNNADPYMGYAYGTNATVYGFQFDVPARVAPTGVTTSGTIQGYSLNLATTITPTFNAANVNGGTLLGSLTITAGQGSRLYLAGGSLILFTGCEL